MKNFWKDLEKPFTLLAPMDDVTDVVMREIVAENFRPDVFFTEFVSADAICSEGWDKQIRKFEYTKKQRPMIAQIWGINPENFYKTAKILKNLGFDGIDINMGCPDYTIIKKGACSALIKNHKLAKEIVDIVKKVGLPVSVKTRLGFEDIQTEQWIGFLLSLNLQALTIHVRTVREMSKVPAHWDEIGKIVEMRNKMKRETVIIGNGDVKSYEEVLDKYDKYKVDGVMIGRGIFHNLFVFKKSLKGKQKSLEQMLNLLLTHARLFTKTWGNTKNFAILRKFFKVYISGFTGANELRIRLMETTSLEETEEVIKDFLKKRNKTFNQFYSRVL